MIRTSIPPAFSSVKRSIGVPSGIAPKLDCVSDTDAASTIVPSISQLHEIGEALAAFTNSPGGGLEVGHDRTPGGAHRIMESGQNPLTLPVKYSNSHAGPECFSSLGKWPSSPAAARASARR